MNHRIKKKALFLVHANVITGAWMSRAFGVLASCRFPKWIQKSVNTAFARAARLNMEEAEGALDTYDSLDALFTRTLKDGARVLSHDERQVVSPVDGHLCAFGKVQEDQVFEVKDHRYSLPELLGTDNFKDRFKDGYFFVIYLSPRNYHRIHSPISGKVTHTGYVPGRLMPVNRLGTALFENLLPENERLTSFVEGSCNGSLAAVCKVGATCVGKISLSYDSFVTNVMRKKESFLKSHEECPVVSVGDELGAFHLGSTVVLVLENKSFVPHSGLIIDHPIKLGDKLGEFIEGC